MTPRHAARLSGMPYEVILEALRIKRLRGHKIRKRWHVKPRDAYRFGQVNQKKIELLSAEYVNLYWQGCTIAQLQNRAKEDFREANIVYKTAGFAEQAIYRSVTKRTENRLRIAAYDAGLYFVGFEIDPYYFRAQEERYAAHIAQLSLFDMSGGGGCPLTEESWAQLERRINGGTADL